MIRSLVAALGSSSSRLLGVGTKSRHGCPASVLYGGAEPPDPPPQPLGVPGCSPEPLGVPGSSPKTPPQPWASTPFLPWDSILGHTRHYFRNNMRDNIKKHVAGGSENQIDELKMRLIALCINAPYSTTAEEILKDPRLDLESLPSVSGHDTLECINRYICVLRTVETSVAYFRCLIFLVIGDYINLSTSPSKLVEILRTRSGFLELDKLNLTSAVKASKIKLLEKLEQKKDYAMCDFYMTGLDQALFTISSQGTNENYIELCCLHCPSSSEWSSAAAERENAKEVSKPKLRSNRKRKLVTA